MFYEGKLLVAPPTMRDHRFSKSVVYLFKHDSDGASGVVINKPLSAPKFAELCRQAKIKVGEGIDQPVFYGGPVGLQIVGCLHTLDYKAPSTNISKSGLGFTLDRNIISDIAMGRGPEHHIVTMGMSSWSRGQLETELEAFPPRSKKESWLIMDYDPDMIWHGANKTMWNACVNVAINESSRNFTESFF